MITDTDNTTEDTGTERKFKYLVTAGVTIQTWIEPQGTFQFQDEEFVEDLVDDSMEDHSSFYGDSFDMNGDIKFEVFATDDSEAQRVAEQALDSLIFSETYGNLEWEVYSAWVVQVEKLPDPMTKERARELLREYLKTLRTSEMDQELVAALIFLAHQ